MREHLSMEAASVLVRQGGRTGSGSQTNISAQFARSLNRPEAAASDFIRDSLSRWVIEVSGEVLLHQSTG